MLTQACSGPPPSSPAATRLPAPTGPEFSAVIITTDLALGSNRVAFGVVDRDGMPVRNEAATVRAIYLPPGQGPGEARASASAKFMRWPGSAQGVFSTMLQFDVSGFWQLEVTTTGPNGKPVVALGAVQIKAKTDTPSIGAPAPPSVTPTAAGVADLATITSSRQPDPDLYRLSIHQALKTGKPLVVVFATPAFCVSATCGPQVEVVSQLKDRFADQANFIHVEVFENPHLIKGGRPGGGFVAAVAEWNLPTEPWTFVIDKGGKVHAKFEQFTGADEIEAALREVL